MESRILRRELNCEGDKGTKGAASGGFSFFESRMALISWSDRSSNRGEEPLLQRDPARQEGLEAAAYQTSNPPAKVSPAPTLQKMILSPELKIPSSAAQPNAIETEAADVFPYSPIVTTNFS